MRRIIFSLILMSILNTHVYAEEYPQRIISLGPVLTEELYLLGAGGRIIAVSDHCVKPEEIKDKASAGEIVDLNIERIVSLKPDLVLITGMASQRDVKKLSDLGLNVALVPYYKSYSEICSEFIKLGKLVGSEKEAREIVNVSEEDVEKLKNSVKDMPKPSVFIQIGSKPLFTAPRDSFIGDFIEFAGGRNIAGDLAGAGMYGIEGVIKNNPDIIIITSMGIFADQEKEKWLKYETISAVKNNRIFIIDPHKVCSPTPVSFVETLKEIIGYIHPGAKI